MTVLKNASDHIGTARPLSPADITRINAELAKASPHPSSASSPNRASPSTPNPDAAHDQQKLIMSDLEKARRSFWKAGAIVNEL